MGEVSGSQENKDGRLILLAGALLGLLAWYFASTRSDSYPPTVVLWFICALSLILIVYQIVKLDESSDLYWAVLLEILILVFILRTVFVPPAVPFFGHDAYREYAASIVVADRGWFMLGRGGRTQAERIYANSLSYPVLHIVNLTLSTIFGLSLLSVARWAPPLYSLLANLLVYAFAYKLHQSKRSALFVCLGFSTAYVPLMLYGLYGRQGMALITSIASIYAYYTAVISDRRIFQTLAIIFAVVTIMAHHMTSLILPIFLGIAFALNKGLRYLKSVIPQGTFIACRFPELPRRAVRLSFILLVLVLMLGYWISLKIYPLTIPGGLLKQEIAARSEKQEIAASSEEALLPVVAELGRLRRYKLLLVGYALSSFAISCMTIYSLLSHTGRRGPLDPSLAVFGGLMGILAVGIGLRIITRSEGMGLAARFEGLGYLNLFLASGYAVADVLKKKERKLTLLVALGFVAFALLNIYRIPPYLYTPRKPAIDQGESASVLSEGEYRAILWLEGNPNVGMDKRLWRKFFPVRGVVIGYYESLLEEDLNVGDYEYVLLSKVAPRKVVESFAALDSSPHLNRVYDAGSAQIYGTRLPSCPEKPGEQCQ